MARPRKDAHLRSALAAAIYWATRGLGTLCMVCGRVSYIKGHEKHKDTCWVPGAESALEKE